MGTLTSYAIYSSIYLLAGYLIYKWLLSGEKQMVMNRATLLFIYLIALLALPGAELLRHFTEATSAKTQLDAVDMGSLEMVSLDASDHSIAWAYVIVYTYIVGMVLTAIWSLISYIRLHRLLASGKPVECSPGIHLVLLPSGKAAPFSWMNYIAMPEDDYNNGAEIIIAHEMAHIRHRHCYDLILAQLVCILQWFNPAAWLMREELKAVHEFQADDTVLKSGIEPRQYQMLLIKKAVGTRFQSLANSLNHSNLKKRITMMYSQKSSAGRKMRVLALVPAIAMALAVCNIPAVASTISATSEVKVSTPSASEVTTRKVSEKSVATQTQTTEQTPCAAPEQLPEFPGGQTAMFDYLVKNVKYPADAAAANQEGRVVVTFVVEADGSISYIKVTHSVSPSLDAEAVRVIKEMPRWIPGKSNGKTVACSYVLPISFRLPSDKK